MMEKQVMMKKQMEMFQMKQNMMKQAQVHFLCSFAIFSLSKKYVTNLQMTILKMINKIISHIREQWALSCLANTTARW